MRKERDLYDLDKSQHSPLLFPRKNQLPLLCGNQAQAGLIDTLAPRWNSTTMLQTITIFIKTEDSLPVSEN